MGIRDEDEAQVGSGLGTQGPGPRTPDGSSHGAAEAGGLGPHGAPGSMTYSQVFEMTTDDHLLLVNIVNFLHQNKAFVYKKGAFSTARKVLSWIAKVVVNLGINSASNNIA